MSQVFAGDSVNGPLGFTVTGATPTLVVTGNFLNPPFQNAKAIVTAMLDITAAGSTTSLTLKLIRNPNAEAVSLTNTPSAVLAGGSRGLFSIQSADVIPDGRAVQYALQVTQNAGSGGGTVWYSSVTALLISG